MCTFTYQKTFLCTLFCLFLKSSKAFSVSLIKLCKFNPASPSKLLDKIFQSTCEFNFRALLNIYNYDNRTDMTIIIWLLHPTVTCDQKRKKTICDALHDLVQFVQFKEREKHPWRSATFCKNARLKVTLLHGCFSRFLNCKNSTKSGNASHWTSTI